MSKIVKLIWYQLLLNRSQEEKCVLISLVIRVIFGFPQFSSRRRWKSQFAKYKLSNSYFRPYTNMQENQ